MQALLGAVMLAVLPLAGIEGGEGVAAFLTRGWVWDIGPVLPIMVMMAVGAVAGVGLIFRAYQLEEPSFVAVFEYALMLFAPLFAWLLFGQTVGWMQAFGILLIIGAGTVIALRGDAPATAGQEHDAPVV